MVTRAMGIIMTATMLSASAASAGSLTDELQTNRMTVVEVDKAAGAVLLRTGDIVRLRRDGGALTIIVLRTAADEIGSLE